MNNRFYLSDYRLHCPPAAHIHAHIHAHIYTWAGYRIGAAS
jgi:hypothetical protein